MVRGLIDFIEVGPLLPVYFDTNKQVIHDLGDLFVLERLMRHDMAPVAGGIADGEQDRLIFPPRLFQRLLVPGMPIHRVVRMLQQVGAGLLNQTVRVRGWVRFHIPV